MEHNKKRRNSILKKTQTNNEETTAEIASKVIRRISFSGKKSVKEFRPGEEEATIWGTSYEESAEVLHPNSTESGLVDVNEKRIILRNRRVIVEPNNKTTKSRSKKKVSLAENDKENVFTQQAQAEASLNQIALPPATPITVTLTESPGKSELALMKIHLEDKNSQTMSEPLERGNICSSTFDFINYSGFINKSITIEQSVDVTLNENELQLFKFRVPVTATDVSPNLNISSTNDGSSPNIFSRSILMSEVDSNMLKLIRGKREIMNSTESHLTDLEARKIEEQRRRPTMIEKSVKASNSEQQENMAQGRKSDAMQLCLTKDTDNLTNQSMNVSHLLAPHSNSNQRKTIINIVDMEEDPHRNSSKDTKNGTLLMYQNVNVSEVAKGLKRKTVPKVEKLEETDDCRMDRRTISHPTAMDFSSMDINSPLRKKPMHNTTNNQMDITIAATVKRQTIHYESAVVEESLTCDVDKITCRSPFNASVEHYIAVPDATRQTIYFDHNQIHEDSICQSTRPTVAVKPDDDTSMDLSGCLETLDADSDSNDIIEDSPEIAKANVTSSGKNRQTISIPVDINEAVDPLVVSTVKPRISIYTPSDIAVDCPSPKKAQKFKVTTAISADITENAVRNQRKSIFTAADITIDDSPKTATVSEPSKKTDMGRQTIYSSTDIDEDVPTQAQPSKSGVKQRQSIYTPTDIIEDSPNGKLYVPQRCNDRMDEQRAEVVQIPSKIPTKQRHTIYPSSDIMEYSPKPIRQHGPHKTNTTHRQSVFIASDMIEDSPLDGKSDVPHCQATYTSSEMADDPSDGPLSTLKASCKLRQSEATADHPIMSAHRQSIYTPSDMIVASPKAANKSIKFSETLQSSVKGVNKQPQTKTYRQSIYTSADMVENSPKKNESTKIEKSSIQQRKSTHFVTEMVEEYPEILDSSLKTGLTRSHRQTIHAAVDMIEDSPKASVVSHHQALETHDDVVAEPPTAKPPKVVVRHFNLKQGISAQQAALRVLKNQQAKTKLLMQANADDSSMEMSVHSDPPTPGYKMNFCQLNEEMLKGKTKGFAKERKGKSLFDDFERKPIEEFKFDSFMDEESIAGCIMQPARNSMRDYTMELSMKQSFSNKKKLNSGYTMDLSLEQTAVKSLPKQQCKQPIGLAASSEDSIDLPVGDLAGLPKNSCDRRTIHLNEDLEEEQVKTRQKNRPTIYFELVKSQVEQPRAANFAHDASTMELPMQDASHASKYKELPAKLNACESVQSSNPQEDDDTMDLCTIGLSNSMSQSKHPSAHAGASLSNDHTMDLYRMGYKQISHATKLQTSPKRDDDTMDLSTVGCSKPLSQPEQQTPPINASQEIQKRQDNAPDYELSMITSKNISKRQTINVHHEMDLDETCHSERGPESDKHSTHSDSDLEVESTLPQSAARRTVYFDQDLELEEQQAAPSNRRLKAPHTYQAPQTYKSSKRATIHFNVDIDLDTEDQEQKTKLVNETTQNTANNAHRIPRKKIVFKTKRHTIHFNEDLEMEKDLSDNHLHYRKSPAPSNASIQKQQIRDLKPSSRLTLHFNDDIEEQARQTVLSDETKRNTAENSHTTSSSQLVSKTKRQTIYFNQDVEVEEDTSDKQSHSGKSPAPIRERIQEQHTADVKAYSRTLHLNDDIEFDETRQNTADSGKSNRQTSHYHQNNDLKKSADQSSRCDPAFQEELLRSLPKPRRVTVLDDAPIDVDESPQKCALRKSSFSRTLNFNAIQTTNSKIQRRETAVDMSVQKQMADDCSPVYCPQPRGHDTTSEIDRSLVEYLKAEQATMHFRSTSQDTSIDMVRSEQHDLQTGYGNDPQSQSKLRIITLEPVNIFEESGMHPLQKVTVPATSFLDATDQSVQDFDSLARGKVDMTKETPLKRSEPPKVMEETRAEFDNSMEMSALLEEPVKPAPPKRSILRKTIHFTNEDAVDESFFDEASMKQKNHPTGFVNESMNPITEMDVTVGNSKNMTRSKAVQSMKEILMENNMLFNQTRPLHPCTFESKRSTIYFTGNKDDSLDMTTVNESMDEIPQRETVDQSVNNVDATASEHEPELHQESFETVEIPRRATSHTFSIFQDSPATDMRVPEQAILQESFDTIEIPRRATNFHQNDTLRLGSNATINTSQKSFYKLEDEPITISNVSTFFSQKPLPATIEPFSPNTTEALCNLDVNVIAVDDQLPKSSDSEDTTQHIDKFKKRYVDLTWDSIRLSASMDDIDKTRLSLVNTLDEEASEMVLPSSSCEKVPTGPASPLKPVASVCRKCKNRLSVTQNNTTIGSFLFDPEPEYKFDLSVLDELASKPKIHDVGKVWRQRMRDSDSFNVSDGSRSIAFDDEDTVQKFIAELDKNRLETASQHRQRKTFKKETSFVQNVLNRMESQKSNWILNELLLASNILRFSHTRIRTFAIFISFTPKDPRGVEVNFNEIKLAPNVLHTRQWTPFDSALHYQLLVELPFDLRKLCATSENLFELLQHVEEVTQNVLKTGKDMLHLVLTSPASLIRESSGSIYIRKCARTKTPQNDVQRTDFVIEVRNIKQLSYKSIVVPPLYEFDEKIQMLPVGPDFLRVFLGDPIQYMKS